MPSRRRGRPVRPRGTVLQLIHDALELRFLIVVQDAANLVCGGIDRAFHPGLFLVPDLLKYRGGCLV